MSGDITEDKTKHSYDIRIPITENNTREMWAVKEFLLQDKSTWEQVQVEDMEEVVIKDKRAAEVFLDKMTSQPMIEYSERLYSL